MKKTIMLLVLISTFNNSNFVREQDRPENAENPQGPKSPGDQAKPMHN